MTLLLGIDIGGTKSAAVLGDADGNVRVRASALTPQESWQAAYALLVGLVRQVCLAEGTALSEITAVGVSCGGPLDSRTGTVYTPPNLPAWDAVPLKSLLEADLCLPVTLGKRCECDGTGGASLGCGARLP